MSDYILAQIELSAYSLGLGIVLMVSYDGLRFFRLLIPHGNFWIGVEDFFYWLYAAAMVFALLFYENSGVLRAYVIVCVFFGMAGYDRLVSRNVFLLLKKLGRWFTIIRHTFNEHGKG